MADEWSMFGSDDEDSVINDGELVVSGSSPSLSSPSNHFARSIEKAADAISNQSTQNFVKMDHTVPLSQRHFGAVKSEASAGCYGEDEVIVLLNQNLSEKIKQRGIQVETLTSSDSDSWEDDYDTAQFDGALNMCVFHHNAIKHGGNDLSLEVLPGSKYNHRESSSLRKSLTLGGYLMVLTVIKHESGADYEGIEWTPENLLRQWKSKDVSTSTTKEEEIFSKAVWDIENATIFFHERLKANGDVPFSYSFYAVSVTKRSCTVNSLSCQWKSNYRKVPKSDKNPFNHENWIDYERRILSDSTVPQSIYEQRTGFFTRESIDKAVGALQKNGFVVLPGLFRNTPEQVKAIKDWSSAILQDFDTATDILKSKYDVDILNPGEGSDPLSYREIAMREDFRVDIRDGPKIKKLRALMGDSDQNVLDCFGYNILDGGEGTAPTIIDTKYDNSGQIQEKLSGGAKDKIVLSSLRYNPIVLDIVRKLQNPGIKENGSGEQPLYKGNFGRWNFSGRGPNGSPQPIRIGQIGSVVSLPGAADQCVHADTAHIFETQDCLPCHYANLFILGEDSRRNDKMTSLETSLDCDNNFTGDNLIGGTAFVAGSHRLSMTAKLTADRGISAAGSEESAQNEMHMRTIRPSLRLGDAIIFDTRTLHFGLANRISKESLTLDKSGLRRPLLYVNLTHSWFFDPKNWDDKQSIFKD